MKINTSILLIIILGVVFLTTHFAKAEKQTIDGMEFTVGENNPEERKNPEAEETKQIIIIDNSDEVLPGEEEIISDEEARQEDENINQEEKNIFAQWSEGIWNVTKDVVLGAAAIFENTVDFLGRVTFMDRVTFADKDMGGEAVIEKGEKEVKIEFENPFIFAPVVTITPQGSFGHFALKDVTEEGFKIIIEEKAENDVEFKWIAIAVADSQADDEEEESDED